MIKFIKRLLCFHHWEPLFLIETYISNTYGLRYGRCLAYCKKCNKVEVRSFLMNNQEGLEEQDGEN